MEAYLGLCTKTRLMYQTTNYSSNSIGKIQTPCFFEIYTLSGRMQTKVFYHILIILLLINTYYDAQGKGGLYGSDFADVKGSYLFTEWTSIWKGLSAKLLMK